MTGGVLAFEVKGYIGGAVVIKCGYDKEYQQNEKYFCTRQYKLGKCNNLIKTALRNRWENAGRFSVYDNTTAGFFMVIFRDLTQEDTKTYYCGVDIRKSRDMYTKVDLKIREGEVKQRVIYRKGCITSSLRKTYIDVGLLLVYRSD